MGNFLIEASNDEVGLSISKELRRVNKRWKKFITKTQLVSSSIDKIIINAHNLYTIMLIESVDSVVLLFRIMKPSL